jgi:hypothetical protein
MRSEVKKILGPMNSTVPPHKEIARGKLRSGEDCWVLCTPAFNSSRSHGNALPVLCVVKVLKDWSLHLSGTVPTVALESFFLWLDFNFCPSTLSPSLSQCLHSFLSASLPIPKEVSLLDQFSKRLAMKKNTQAWLPTPKP